MITVFVTIRDRVELLPYFFEYYTKLGADRFVVIISGGRRNPLWEKCFEIKSQSPMVVLEGCLDGPHGGIENDVLNQCRKHFPKGWHVVCDLDEFHSFGGSLLPGMVETLERTGMKATQHLFADRLAKDLSFPVISGKLDDTFPLKSNLTETMGADVTKIGIIWNEISTGVGHHHAPCQTLYNGFTTHHFKWSDGIVERMQKRIIFYDRLGIAWSGESKRLLKNIKNGRINPETPGLKIEQSERLGI